jgi:dipeptidase E
MVLGLREGSWIEARQGVVELKGRLTARLFKPGVQAVEIAPGVLDF